MAHSSTVLSDPTTSVLPPGEIAARLDRLPLSAMHWLMCLTVQLAFGLVLSVNASSSRLYPFVWAPAGEVTPTGYALLFMIQVGVGILLGEWLFGFISDRIGRKRAMVLAIVVVGLFFLPLAFSSNTIFQAVFSGIAALGIGGMFTTNVVYMQEIAPPAARSRLSLASQAFGYFIFGGVTIFSAALFPQYWQFWIFGSSAAILLIALPLVIFLLPESPRWLEGKGRTDHAVSVLERLERRASKGGRRPLPAWDLSSHAVVEVERVPLRELFSRAYLGRVILLSFCSMLIYAGGLYGFSQFASVHLAARGLSPAIILTVSGVGLAAGGVLGLIVLAAIGERLERKTTIFLSSLVFSAGVLMMMLGDDLWIPAAGVFLTGFSISVTLANIQLYASNAFPTRFRSAGVGWTDGIGHSGAIWGPFVVSALYVIPGTNGWAWALWCIIAGALLPSILMLVFGRRQNRKTLESLTQ